MVYLLCEQCALPNPVDNEIKKKKKLVCARCQFVMNQLKPKSLSRTLAYSITALILYVPANLFPFLTMEIYGSRSSATIWNGITTLIDAGSWTVALIVFLASILIPFMKLVILFYLAFTARNGKNRRAKTYLYNVVDNIGRWSMLDIFLLAVLVSLMKLGPLANVEPEVGSLLFVLVVVFTMLASASFDSRLLWQSESEIKKDEISFQRVI